MCLTALAWQAHPKFPLVLAANRDEFHDRPTAPMQWWDDGHTLAGKDLHAGGTWLGVSRAGRIGILTNVREPGRHDAALPSRGARIPWWLERGRSEHEMSHRLDAEPTNGYNLLGMDVGTPALHYWSNRQPHRHHLPAGLYGLSNAGLDTPWPKLQRLKGRLNTELNQPADSAERVLERLLDALQDRHQPRDEELPRTGVPMEWERTLGRVFIQTPDGRYGTRCSTVMVLESTPQKPWRLHVVEQSWDAQGRAGQRVHHQVIATSAN
jgi:uncharacterized protein with NRDE domain